MPITIKYIEREGARACTKCMCVRTYSRCSPPSFFKGGDIPISSSCYSSSTVSLPINKPGGENDHPRPGGLPSSQRYIVAATRPTARTGPKKKKPTVFHTSLLSSCAHRKSFSLMDSKDLELGARVYLSISRMSFHDDDDDEKDEESLKRKKKEMKRSAEQRENKPVSYESIR